MKPIVVACHSGVIGNRSPLAPRRISRQRIVRTGNVNVARTTVTTSSQPFACSAYVHTLRGSILYRTHTSNAALRASPMSQAPPLPPRQRCGLLGFDGEDNEIADFVDDGAEPVAAGPLGGFAQLLDALAGASAPVEESPDVNRLRSVTRGPLGRSPAYQLFQRRRSDAGRDQLLITRPAPRNVSRRPCPNRRLGRRPPG